MTQSQDIAALLELAKANDKRLTALEKSPAKKKASKDRKSPDYFVSAKETDGKITLVIDTKRFSDHHQTAKGHVIVTPARGPWCPVEDSEFILNLTAMIPAAR